MLTELKAVNIMLSAIGEPPVDTLESLHPDVLSSKLLLEHARYEVLSPGRWFNTEYNITLNINTDNEIILPSTCLSVDAADTALNYMARQGKLYDGTKHTYKFDASVIVDMVFDLTFNDMPFVVQNLITMNAASALQANFVGDDRKLQNLALRLKAAREAFNSAEIVAIDANARNTPYARKLLSGLRRYYGSTL